MAELEKVIRGLERCLNTGNFEECTENCPYFTKKLGMGVCSENMQRDALSLLKAHEPRVMTLEDAKQTMEGEIVWVEQWTKSKVFLMPMVSTGDGRLGNFYLGLNLNEMNPHYYRVWRGKPTDEQREAVKWE